MVTPQVAGRKFGMAKRHFSNEILGWIIDPDSKTGKNWHARYLACQFLPDHDPDTKRPKSGNSASLVYPPEGYSGVLRLGQ
jgi:hypothetical protein